MVHKAANKEIGTVLSKLVQRQSAEELDALLDANVLEAVRRWLLPRGPRLSQSNRSQLYQFLVRLSLRVTSAHIRRATGIVSVVRGRAVKRLESQLHCDLLKDVLHQWAQLFRAVAPRGIGASEFSVNEVPRLPDNQSWSSMKDSLGSPKQEDRQREDVTFKDKEPAKLRHRLSTPALLSAFSEVAKPLEIQGATLVEVDGPRPKLPMGAKHKTAEFVKQELKPLYGKGDLTKQLFKMVAQRVTHKVHYSL